MSSKTLFVSFEGIEGSGKSTQISLLQKHYQAQGRSVLSTREPGGTKLGERMRALFTQEEKMSDRCEFLLVSAARAQHVQELLLPSMGKYDLILCDRYMDSSVAYQSAGRDLDVDTVHQINAFATQGLVPDLTIFLDIPVELSLERVDQRQSGNKDRFEKQDQRFHEKVRQGYQDLCKKQSDRIKEFDGTQDSTLLSQQLIQSIDRKASW
ncbi:MAG: dTMP kinase [Bdellovibrionales bacterium]|nr:dTMP kinase [Bdellovibrionales bacterium]